MKVLVYGAGVLGCELASVLCRGKCHVTLLARGSWKETIDERGLTVRHPLQLRTTRDRLTTVDHLEPHWVFDLIFVVMQAGQLPDILPELARNLSHHLVFIGNNADPAATEAAVESIHSKEVAFGFLSAAGRREGTRVVSLHLGVQLTVGGSDGPLSPQFQKLLEKAAERTPLRYTFQPNMDAWLKAHLTIILPLCYAVYAQNGHIDRLTPAQQATCLDAALEGCRLLRAAGVPVSARDNDDWYTPGPRRWWMARLIWLLVHTPLGPLCVSDHAMHAIDEFRYLDQDAERWRSSPSPEMPAWDALRQEALHILRPGHHRRAG